MGLFGFVNLGTEIKFVRFHVPYFSFTAWPLDYHGQWRKFISKFHSGLFFLCDNFHIQPILVQECDRNFETTKENNEQNYEMQEYPHSYHRHLDTVFFCHLGICYNPTLKQYNCFYHINIKPVCPMTRLHIPISLTVTSSYTYSATILRKSRLEVTSIFQVIKILSKT